MAPFACVPLGRDRVGVEEDPGGPLASATVAAVRRGLSPSQIRAHFPTADSP